MSSPQRVDRIRGPARLSQWQPADGAAGGRIAVRSWEIPLDPVVASADFAGGGPSRGEAPSLSTEPTRSAGSFAPVASRNWGASNLPSAGLAPVLPRTGLDHNVLRCVRGRMRPVVAWCRGSAFGKQAQSLPRGGFWIRAILFNGRQTDTRPALLPQRGAAFHPGSRANRRARQDLQLTTHLW